MINRFITILAFFSLVACTSPSEKDAFPDLMELVIVDSILVQEKNYFLNGQMEVQIVGDSLLAISAFKTPALGFTTTAGAQRKRIASGDYPIGYFLPSGFDATRYPIVYVIDNKSGSVFEFNVEEQTLVKKIKLDLPDGKKVKFAGSKFKKLKDGFLIELASSDYDNYDPKYYQKAGDLMYVFDENGNQKNESFLTYPEEIKRITGSLAPIEYFVFTSKDESLLFSFPYDKKIRRFDQKDLTKPAVEIELPKSRYFDFSIAGSDQIISFQEMFNSGKGLSVSIPSVHTFSSIQETSSLILLQTWMVGDETKGLNRTTNLLVYDKKGQKWSETSNPRNILDIGMLAGVVNDTLYFYEGSLMNRDEKYIRKAVLRPASE